MNISVESRILAVDPATHGVACADFRNGKLARAGYAKNRSESENIIERCVAAAQAAIEWECAFPVFGVDVKTVLVCELPQIYQRSGNKSKGDPNKNVLPLAMVNSALAALLKSRVEHMQPHAWKGNTKKPKRVTDSEYVIKRWVKMMLTSEELEVVDWTESIAHSWDVADAIGIGLAWLGRFKKHRNFARD